MPVILQVVGAWLIANGAKILMMILVGLGLSWVSFDGTDLLVGQMITLVEDRWASIPADMLAIASMLGIDNTMTLILSGYPQGLAIRATFKGAEHAVWRRPGANAPTPF